MSHYCFTKEMLSSMNDQITLTPRPPEHSPVHHEPGYRNGAWQQTGWAAFHSDPHFPCLIIQWEWRLIIQWEWRS